MDLGAIFISINELFCFMGLICALKIVVCVLKIVMYW